MASTCYSHRSEETPGKQSEQKYQHELTPVTNAKDSSYDYTKGKLGELIDIIIDSGVKLFVSAVGVPPKEVVDRLHQHGILYMNMIGHPKHVAKCLEIGVDIICAQGGEGGGHTG